MESWIYFLGFGAIAGWIANFIMRGRGIGLIGNIVIGVLGSMIGSWLFAQLGISVASGLVGSLISAVAGAVVLLFAVGLIRR